MIRSWTKCIISRGDSAAETATANAHTYVHPCARGDRGGLSPFDPPLPSYPFKPAFLLSTVKTDVTT